MDKPHRVALFHPSLTCGGIPQVFINLARGFLEHGLAVDMIQATPEGGFRDAVPDGVRLVDLSARRALTSLAPLVRYLRRERPHIMISGAVQTNIVAVWARRLAAVPMRLILTEHNIISVITTNARMLRTRTTPFLIRQFYPWADDIVAVSHGAAQDLAHILGPAKRIHVIYNPVVGPEFWRRAAEPLIDPRFDADPRPVILAVGRLHYHKDYPTLLRALALVRNEIDVRAVFLGDGEERDRLLTLARELNVESAVSFLGNVSNPLPYMKRAAVLALSSVVEALPTVLIEALAVGLPIVATDCPTGPREILCDGAFGSLVPVRDSQRLAEALSRVLQSQRGTAVPEEALARFRQDRVIGEYLQLIGLSRVHKSTHTDLGHSETLTTVD
jgi:glycosyltransferase involved in cell wall biosynthesis